VYPALASEIKVSMDKQDRLIKVKYSGGEYWLPVLFVVAAVIGVQVPPGSDTTLSVGVEGAEGANGANGGNVVGTNGEDGIGRDGTDGNANGADGANGGNGDVEGLLIIRGH
jgi:hypothetical protein